ncbi:hypothetical protein VDBG_08997 [Verticillium alfalfae VaMs.102]|uniref:Uncharacterized protein n=1 Tax=Verticillium alfalfae (strain VaMs.102 / ATCC MYA-4576 / FGSC 10136) TaxID=526221 RepID=C9SVS2_VERA1|nr:hypothetical protein VDBG_08997 [Verticillium alfalfae VaMs.102]EEY22887.1 hypothetical protein VDBG_08997 [Verticillium alfalfae VaMs.102]KAH6699543.1 hypothetical protein EV126DRAFT_342791 [Verticillium dahliae]
MIQEVRIQNDTTGPQTKEITHPKRMAIILDVLFEAANLKTPLESPKPTITWSFCQRLSLHASILYHSQLQALWVTQRSLIKDPTGLITTLLCWTRQTILHALLSLASWRYLGISGRRLPANVVVGGSLLENRWGELCTGKVRSRFLTARKLFVKMLNGRIP